MATGLTRRETPKDSLAGRTEMEPVTLRGPGVSAPRGFTPPSTRASEQVAAQLGGWSSRKLETAVNKQQQRDILEGQMDHIQGQTFEDVEMGGNKFALEGYRIMEAQTLASTMLAAQREEIAQSAHVLDPESYKARLSARLDAMTEGLDPRTAELVQQQFAQQLPTLIADQTATNMRYLEGKNYEALSTSIEVISRDPTATDQLVLFAQGGEGSPSAGLSDDRRQAATVDGVIRAFDMDNPLAYAALAKEGLLGENLTTDQYNAIQSANQRFQNRRRSEYDKALFDGEQAIMRKVERNELRPSEAVEELSILYADHNIEMNAAEAGSVYNSALTTERQGNLTAATNFEEARLRGDYATMANITLPILIQIESGGDPNAVSHKGARGLMQVMDYTNADPGFGVRPAQNNSAEERVRVGQDYWKAMLGGSSNHSLQKWEAGDLEAAAIAYNAGPGVANKWIAAGRDDAVLPQETRDYKAKMTTGLQGWKAPTQADRLEIAEARLETTRDRLAIDTYERTEPMLNDADTAFKNGEVSKDDWLQQRREIYAEHDRARTEADVNHEISVSNQVREALVAKAESTSDDTYRDNLATAQTAIAAAEVAFKAVTETDGVTKAEIVEAVQTFNAARNTALEDAGIAIHDRGDAQHLENIAKQTSDAFDRAKEWQEEAVEIDAAIQQGFVKDLPADLRERAFKQIEQTIGANLQNEVAEGRMTVEDAQVAMGQEFQQAFAEAGMVDPRVARRMSAAMQRPFIDADGNPDPNMVDTVTQYAELKAMNPYAADTFFSDEAHKSQAEELLSMALDPSGIADAVQAKGMITKGSQHIDNPKEYVRREDVVAEIDRTVHSALEERDIGPLHAIWQKTADWSQIWDRRDSDTEAMFGPEVKELLTAQVTQEVTRIKQSNPGLSTGNIVDMAMENVAKRTEVVGQSVVSLGHGNNVREMFFGNRANDFKHDSDINSAVVHYLRSDEFAEEYGWTDSTFAEMLPGWAQSGIDSVVSPFGGSFDPAMSMREAISTGTTGVRPYRALPTPDGKSFYIEVLKPDGNWSTPIMPDWREVGNSYYEFKKGELTQ